MEVLPPLISPEKVEIEVEGRFHIVSIYYYLMTSYKTTFKTRPFLTPIMTYAGYKSVRPRVPYETRFCRYTFTVSLFFNFSTGES